MTMLVRRTPTATSLHRPKRLSQRSHVRSIYVDIQAVIAGIDAAKEMTFVFQPGELKGPRRTLMLQSWKRQTLEWLYRPAILMTLTHQPVGAWA